MHLYDYVSQNSVSTIGSERQRSNNSMAHEDWGSNLFHSSVSMLPSLPNDRRAVALVSHYAHLISGYLLLVNAIDPC